jgi:plasmid stability protein
MAQLVVRNMENAVKIRLQRRARRTGRSMEAEVREILRNAVNQEEDVPAGGLGSEIAALFAKAGFDSEIAELRSLEDKPAVARPRDSRPFGKLRAGSGDQRYKGGDDKAYK